MTPLTKGIKALAAAKGTGAGSSVLIDTVGSLSKILDSLEGLPAKPPSLYVDVEGVNLSKHGRVSIVQIHVLPSGDTHLFDITTLRRKAFTTPGATSGRTLKQLLEAEHVPKVFFDVRNDSDALYGQFRVRLAGVQDLQLMELAARQPRGLQTREKGLSRCIQEDAPLTAAEKAAWKAGKKRGIALFRPAYMGRNRCAVFDERPLRAELREYCVSDVKYLPRLWSHYHERLTPEWQARVCEATKARLAESRARVTGSRTPGDDNKRDWDLLK